MVHVPQATFNKQDWIGLAIRIELDQVGLGQWIIYSIVLYLADYIKLNISEIK